MEELDRQITPNNSRLCEALRGIAKHRWSGLDAFRARAAALPEPERSAYLETLDERPITLEEIRRAWLQLGYSSRSWEHTTRVDSAWHTFGGWTIVSSAQAGAVKAETYVEDLRARMMASQRAFANKYRTDWTRQAGSTAHLETLAATPEEEGLIPTLARRPEPPEPG